MQRLCVISFVESNRWGSPDGWRAWVQAIFYQPIVGPLDWRNVGRGMYQWYTQKPDNSAGVSGVSSNERTDAANISPTPPVIIWLGFSDLVDLWVIKIFKKRSREQSTKLKRRSRSESLRKVCLFHYPSERLNLVPRALRVSSVEGPGDEVVKDYDNQKWQKVKN